MPLVQRLGLVILTLAASSTLRAKDAYGNNTPWSNSDSTIRDIQVQRNRAERPRQWWDQYSSTPAPAPYWEQQALRRQQQAEAMRQQAERDRWDNYERSVERTPPKPVSYQEYLEARVRNHSDRAAQAELAFYLMGIGQPIPAIPHLEMVVFLKKDARAGEAAWKLFRIASPDGAQPDPKRAEKYLKEAIALKYDVAMFGLAQAWIFGDKKLGIAPDLEHGLILMEAVLNLDSSGYRKNAGEILFKEYAFGIKGPANPAKAIAVSRRMRELDFKLENWQADAMIDLLIASPGGWAEHHQEILAAIESNFSAILNPDKAERLARIYLGLDPETLPFVPPNPKKAAEALRGLAVQDVARAKPYLPALLAPGPRHNAEGAFSILDQLREKQPRDVTWLRTTVELLSNVYGDSFKPNAGGTYLDRVEKNAETPVQLLTLAQFLAVGTKDFPAQPERADRLIARAVSDLRTQVEKTHSTDFKATYELARLHVLGLGVPRDIPAAIQLLKSHGSSDEPPEILYPHRVLLASIYLAGYSVERQPRVARSLLRHPARKGFVPAQAAYAEMLSTWDDPQDLDDGAREEAFRYAKAASEVGDVNARLTLANFYENGFGTQADPELALKIYEDGATAGVPGALTRLASLRLDESTPFHDDAAGFAAAERAAALGDLEGTYLLARCWEDGRGTTADVARALALFEEGARAGHWGCAVSAARLLTISAPPITPDMDRGKALLEQAAVTATNRDQYHLVQLFLGDAFLPEDKAKALHWNRIAAKNGSEDAVRLFRPGHEFADVPDAEDFQYSTL